MSVTGYIKNVLMVSRREVGIMVSNPMYWFCMVVFPLLTMFFFTSLMDSGQPQDMPVGVVDLDNTSTSRDRKSVV